MHRPTFGALEGALTGRLIEAVESDFLPVKPPRQQASAP